MRKFNGFTLAEVLITLGIIGVVAAMTMPTLINQTNGAQYKAAYKKALSAISQGVTLNVALDDISFADTVQGQAGKTDVATGKTGTTMAKLLSDRMNVVKITEDGAGEDSNPKRGYAITGTLPTGTDTVLFFNDSSMFAFKNAQDGTECTMTSTTSGNNKGCFGYIDVNGAKGPNKVVSCDDSTKNKIYTWTDGKKEADVEGCVVTSPTDVYPVIYYDQTISPASSAATVVLYGK